MRKLSTELDSLMWYLAEQGDTKAVEEFEARYPDQKYELARRIAMLRSLRVAGKTVRHPHELPRFQPIEGVRLAPSRRAVYGVGLLSLAAIAAATYTVVSFSQPPVSKPEPAPVIKQETTLPKEPTHAPEVVYTNPPSSTEPTPTEPKPDPVESFTPKYLQPQNVKIENAPLVAALQMIAAQGGIQLTIGEGMSNPDVKIAYHGRNTLEILQDLGHEYGFTPFDEGDGSVLIIPAVDPAAQKKEPIQAPTGGETLPPELSVKPDKKKAATP